MAELGTDSIECFAPTVNDKGRVNYPEVAKLLTERDSSSIEALNSLAERGLLNKEYKTKVYICPSCQIEGLQYITGCPSCKSTHTIRTRFFEHKPCSYSAPSDAFETEDNGDLYYCPNCEDKVEFSEFHILQKHLCNECDESFDNPNHQLWCLECLHICPPANATEQTLYEYHLTENGDRWYRTQTEARELLADEFDTRGFDVSVDTELQNDEGILYDVHIHARDELLNQRIIADIHSTVTPENIQYLGRVAEELQAQPYLLITEDSAPETTLQAAYQHGVTLLWIDQNGSIQRYESLEDEHRSPGTIIDRLSSAVGFKSAEES
ncbi:hypothetical protein [Halalkalicoccus tibetensis]|uniref:Thaumarchaeal output domain-containing protein n=1 Tax=Halalkalicoccus tibetensis TaxID=175632 RepID=A0ABD5V6M0_9EURY